MAQPPRRVIASLHFIPSQYSDAAITTTAALSAHLPLRDLQWKPSSRSTTRTIESLDLDFQDFAALRANRAAARASLASSASSASASASSLNLTRSTSASSATSSLASATAGAVPGRPSLLEKPYLHLLFVSSDDNDQYRVTLRPQIREWIDAVMALSPSKRAPQTSSSGTTPNGSAATAAPATEWLIVHVTTATKLASSGPAKFYQRKGSVYDKIRADFNVGKKDRCVQIALPGAAPAQAPGNATTPNTEDAMVAQAWQDFLARIKRDIVASFDTNFSTYEEDVRRIDAQRQMPGWNFCTFFIMKEGLAHSFEAMNLLEDALIQYDELEASYALSGRDQALPWFSSLGGTEHGDDSLSPCSPSIASRKPFRDLIASNSISIFDFRVYLFSRQADLVVGLGRVDELAKRSKMGIYSMARLLRAHGGALPPHFLESWVYTAALSAVARCRGLLKARHNNMNPAAIPELMPALAELLELGCRQVEKLGMDFGHLPRRHPFLMSSSLASASLTDSEAPQANMPAQEAPFRSSNAELQAGLQGQSSFDELYRSLLDQIVDAWHGSLRQRSAIKVRATIAALEQLRENAKASEGLYSTLTSTFSHTSWRGIESQLLRQTCALQHELAQPKDQLLSTLALIRSGLEAGSLRWTLAGAGAYQSRQGDASARSLMADVKRLSEKMDKDFAALSFPAFAITLAGEFGSHNDDDEGVAVDLIVTNHLPCTLPVDEVRLKMTSMSGESLWLACGSIELRPGRNKIRTTSSVSVVGPYALELSQIRLSRIVFQYPHRPAGQGTLAASAPALAPASRSLPHAPTPRGMLAQNQQPLLTFLPDPHGVHVTAENASEAHLDRPRRVILSIHPGRSLITKGTLRLLPPHGRIGLHPESACALDNVCDIEDKDGVLVLSTIKADAGQIMRIAVDYDIYCQDTAVRIGIVFEYYSRNWPSAKRTLRASVSLALALSLSINVQDYLQDTSVISRFTISTDADLPLQIRSAALEGTTAWKAYPCTRHRREAVLVSSSEPVGFLFRIERGATPTKAEEDNKDSQLRLVLIYRTSESEIRALVRKHFDDAFASCQQRLSQQLAAFLVAAAIAAHPDLQEQSLGRAQDVRLGTFDGTWWRARLRLFSADEDSCSQWITCLRRAYDTPLDTQHSDEVPWSSLSVPFEVPSVAIYNRVSLSLASHSLSRTAPVRVGDALRATMSIRTSCVWAAKTELAVLARAGPKGQRMLYDVSTRLDDWRISAPNKGEFRVFAPEIDPDGAIGPSPNEQVTEIELNFTPLRPGRLFFPAVAILPLPEVEAEAGDDAPSESSENPLRRSVVERDPQRGGAELPTCETNHQTAAMSIDVLPREEIGQRTAEISSATAPEQASTAA